MSVSLHMIANGGDTEGLFHGAFMESGSVIPAGDVSLGQQGYDNLVQAVGCTGTEDTLECLRQAPFSALMEVMNKSPGIFAYWVCHHFLDPLDPVVNYTPQPLDFAWAPKADGTFLKAPLQQLVFQGSVVNIPFVTGNGSAKSCVSSLTGRPGYFR